MGPRAEALLARWLGEIAARPLALASARNQAQGNVHAFSAGAAREAGVTVEALAAFIGRAEGQVARKAEAARVSGLFHAWYDEQAGQLRASFVEVPGPEDLPFGCTVVPTQDAVAIARPALEDATPGVITWSELRDVGEAEPPATVEPYLLTVYCRSVGR